jgi:LuxR family maltose regulon positive regulatory protein
MAAPRTDQVGSVTFPIQAAKITCPPLGAETLRRDRLLDWLHGKIHHRAVFVVAEAGYGKTTLLTDYSQRTRLRTMWYRLDDEDRDPVAFLNYLVAAGQTIDPAFAPTTAAMLRELGTGTILLDQVIATFLHELGSLDEQGAVLILDDYHLVDDAPDVRGIVRGILTRAPDRLSVVLLTRRRPLLPIARLRARGEIAELGTDDLRFRPDETEQLFRETYGRPLETDVLEELSQRTEGWAASLQLVRSAIRDRSSGEVRAFIRGIAGSNEDLYDYLAEEVIGELDPMTQRFLMHTAVLQTVDPVLAALVSHCSEGEARARIDLAERSGLLGRRTDHGQRTHRYHPLVRDFLLERLTRAEGPTAARDLHRVVAAWADGQDWRLAAYHYAAAGDAVDLHRVLAGAIASIMATGEFTYAEAYLERHPPDTPHPAFEIFLSRLDFYRNRPTEALQRAQAAVDRVDDDARPSALLNLAAVEFLCGNVEAASAVAARLKPLGPRDPIGRIALVFEMVVRSASTGSIDVLNDELRRLLAAQVSAGDVHHAGISALNLAVGLLLQDRLADALEASAVATECLERGVPRPEAANARVTAGMALARMGRLEEAAREVDLALGATNHLSLGESLTEASQLHLWFGDRELAAAFLGRAAEYRHVSDVLNREWLLTSAEAALVDGDTTTASRALDHLSPSDSFASAGQVSRLKAAQALLAVVTDDRRALDVVRRAGDHAARQDAHLWTGYAELLEVCAAGTSRLPRLVLDSIQPVSAVNMLAQTLASHLGQFDQQSLDAISSYAGRFGVRWRKPLRHEVDGGEGITALRAAQILDEVGEVEDIRRLRRLVRSRRVRGPTAALGRGLARRLAPRVVLDDLGATRIQVGRTSITGSSVRRKALALLVFLASRPDFAATRDQVLDALWPEQEPTDAVNSVNQTVYFLRRVFEPEFSEDLSPGYLHHDSDVIWLDRELVSSRAGECWRLLEAIRRSRDSADVERLSELYTGPFALEFSYDDWAARYRDALHAGYVDAMERAVMADVDGGHFDRALRIARRAVVVEPAADNLHVLQIRICRRLGAHAAAAEHYSVYSSMLRAEYGLEPPPLESL